MKHFAGYIYYNTTWFCCYLLFFFIFNRFWFIYFL